MSWLQRYRLRDFLRNSVWLPPLFGILAALLANRLALSADRLLGWQAPVSAAGLQNVLSALASAMLTFIVFVLSILLLAVQLASAQLTPRVIAHFYRGWTLRLSLSVFVFVFTFDLAVLSRIDGSMPAVSGYLAVYGTVASIAVFLFMIEKVGKSLRPVSVLTSIGRSSTCCTAWSSARTWMPRTGRAPTAAIRWESVEPRDGSVTTKLEG